ncbi:ABC transporter ATP-binding protein [[Eubacterium] cellulosolvens]
MARVRLSNLVKRFGETTAVDNLSIAVEDKEFLVLLGPSGCGKTTALRCIAGLETPDSGEIYIGDDMVNEVPPKDRDIAMVFQSYALYPHMTVYNNLAFPLKMRKTPKSEIDRSVKDAARLLRIERLLNRKPKQLSGGEAQRVALGRSIVRSPKVFLMDEPLSNLDAKLRLYMRAELKRLQKELGTTTIYVTHDQAEAMTMGDRVAIMNLGELQQLSTPDEAYNNSANLFVAGFIGSPPMNFIDCTYQDKDRTLHSGEAQFTLPKDMAGVIKRGITDSDVVLGFRPEDVTLHDRPIPNSIKTEIYVYEPLGSEIIVDLKLGDNLLKAKVPPDTKLKIGETKHLTIKKEKMHIFDKKTGKNLI